MSKFTPGPWECVGTDIRQSKESPQGYMYDIAEVGSTYSGHDGLPEQSEAEANAYLIAAAPEMYDFIETLENDDGKIPDWLWEKRNQVLAKARGEVEA